MAAEKILIVDDEHSLLRLSQILLQKRGYIASVALSVREAKLFLEKNGPVDLLILDLMMPEESGEDMIAWKNTQPDAIKNIPVIVNTAKNLKHDEREFLEKNCIRILQKGTDFSGRLVAQVDEFFKNKTT